MAKTRSMTKNQSHDDAFRRKKIKTCEKGVVLHWPDLNHDVLLLVMMQLGVIHFVSFSGVCKSWRSFALFNRKMFMASRPPMYMSISPESNEKACYLEDSEGRKFKTIIPHLAGRICVGLTCGYLVLFGKETKDFWLVNPIKRHQLRFPNVPYSTYTCPSDIRGILVFSHSMSRWVFVVAERYLQRVWFSIAGEGAWNHVSCNDYFLDLHAFKGKIYTINTNFPTTQVRYLCEMRLGLEPKLMLLETKNFIKIEECPHLVSMDESLHMLEYISEDSYKVHRLDFGEMKWVCPEKANQEYAFYRNRMMHITAVKRESLAGKDNVAYMWYFPHDCLNVNRIDE